MVVIAFISSISIFCCFYISNVILCFLSIVFLQLFKHIYICIVMSASKDRSANLTSGRWLSPCLWTPGPQCSGPVLCPLCRRKLSPARATVTASVPSFLLQPAFGAARAGAGSSCLSVSDPAVQLAAQLEAEVTLKITLSPFQLVPFILFWWHGVSFESALLTTIITEVPSRERLPDCP